MGVAEARSDVARASVSPGDATAAGTSIDAFGLDLYRAIAKSGTNIVISPASIGIALAMARAGARGDTATQMDAVMRSLGTDQGAAGINALAQALSSRSGTFKDMMGGSHDLTLRIANAPYVQQGLNLQPGFLDALASRFGAGIRLVDYKKDPEAARQLINGWVSDQTEKRIPQLLAQGTVDDLTRLMLVNAIYLKAPWATPFNVAATATKPFIRADGSTVSVPTMATGGELAYAKGSGWQAVELPYLGQSLAMTLILPDDMSAFTTGLDSGLFGQIVSGLSTAEVDLSLPRFSIETATDLAQTLGAMGMPIPFDPNRADFSGISTDEPLYISHVIHQANISVDEKGTEAAAATAVGISAGAAPLQQVVLKLDHPFLFALRDVQTGAILFLGQVADPSATS